MGGRYTDRQDTHPEAWWWCYGKGIISFQNLYNYMYFPRLSGGEEGSMVARGKGREGNGGVCTQ